MKTVLKVFVLMVIIFSSIAFIVLRTLAQGSEDNFFNQNWRSEFAQYPVLRSVLGLHFDGDAKSDYLGKYKKLVIEVDWMQGHEIPSKSLELVKDKITSATGMEVFIAQSDEIPRIDKMTELDISETVKKYRNVTFGKNSANIYLLYGSSFGGHLENLGSTYEEYGILVYDSALRNFTAQNMNTFENYVESTVLHEFGHQLGLPHNDIEGCLMNDHVESNVAIRERVQDVVVDFCDYEKKLIQQAL